MAKRIRRKNEKVLSWLRAAAMAVMTFLPLAATHFEPGWGAVALALLVAALTLVSVDLGVLAAVIAVSLPILASNILIGAAFLVIAIALTRFIGTDSSQAYLLVALAVLGAFKGPVWAAALVCGYLLGTGEGAIAAAIACVSVEVIGLLLGLPSLYGTVTAGTAAAAGAHAVLPLDFAANADKSMFAFGWVKDSFGAFGPGTLTGMKEYLLSTKQISILIAQPFVWAGAAAATGALSKAGRRRKLTWLPYVALLVGGLVTALGAAVMVKALGGTAMPKGIAWSLISSLAVAGVLVVLLERVFVRQAKKHKKSSSTMSMAAEDADVDELLHLISTAEERLASQHTTEKVVMITDMKSFSRMTEEDGSMLTAKAIQKHRDLLLPIVQLHGGHGKSTGGDGLVAAFDSPEQAVIAAAEMQQALDANNVAHPNEREMFVRIGIAEGEIVLDKGGRPFLGAALNLAARVMNLADGGQAFVASSVAEKAGKSVRMASHGDFELKNIAKPVQVMEILWAPDQQPMDPRNREN